MKSTATQRRWVARPWMSGAPTVRPSATTSVKRRQKMRFMHRSVPWVSCHSAFSDCSVAHIVAALHCDSNAPRHSARACVRFMPPAHKDRSILVPCITAGELARLPPVQTARSSSMASARALPAIVHDDLSRTQNDDGECSTVSGTHAAQRRL